MINKLALLMVMVALLAVHSARASEVKNPVAMTSKHGNKSLIDITSDQLDVLQDKNQAIFTGHVVAIQDTMRLKSEKMTVYYRKQDDKTANAKKPAEKTPVEAQGEKPQGAIQRIDVEKNVFITTPEETASGDNGTYDVDKHMIYLNDHVILTKGKNTLKGDHLAYDLNTGQSVLKSGDAEKPSGNQPSSKRVHALLMPDDKSDAAKKTATPDAPQGKP